jgi:hypothetical protein
MLGRTEEKERSEIEIATPSQSPSYLKRIPAKLKDKLWQERAIKNHELLAVNEKERLEDIADKTIMCRSKEERAPYKVKVQDGLFMRDGKLFDTSMMRAHGKYEYAAFTLNMKGKLSVFEHQFGRDNITHSTMNAGEPVIGAGELIIKDGKLVGLNTFSGHYNPTVFNVYRTLTYFESQGIDTSQTVLYTYKNPTEYGFHLPVEKKPFLVFYPDEKQKMQYWYAIKTDDLRKAFQKDLKEYSLMFKSKLDEHDSGFRSYFFKKRDELFKRDPKTSLTAQRAELAQRYSQQLGEITKLIERATNYLELDYARVVLKRTLRALKEDNNKLSDHFAKGQNNGRLATNANTCLKDMAPSLQLSKRFY